MINSQYVQECRRLGKQSGNVRVEISISTEEGRYHFQREAVFSLYGKEPIKTDETFSVLAPNNKYYEDEESVLMFLYRYLPQDINDYIFFDGEQLDEYFKEGKRGQIELGIKGLTQATIVKKAIDAFNRYLKKELIPVLENADDTIVKKAQLRVNDLTGKVSDLSSIVDELEKQKKQCLENLDKLNTIIKGHETLRDKAILLEKADKAILDFNEQIEMKYSEMMKFTREYYTYFMLYPKMKRLYDYIHKQEQEGNLPPKVDKKLVETILESKSCPICGSHDLDDQHLRFVANVLSRLEFSSKTSNELNKTSVALLDIFKKISQYPEKVKEHRSALNFLETQKQEKEKEYKELNDFMHTITDSEKITKAINEKEEWEKTKVRLIEKLAVEKDHLQRREAELENAQLELDKAMLKNKAYAKLQKQKKFCEDSIRVLKQAMEEVLCDCREELQSRTFEIFNQLMWKKDTFKEVIIDEEFVFHLLNNYDEETLGSCSAAERGLLALSFTMALQEISQHDSLLYIDTPLGRVGTKNRINFSEILKDISENKQVILSFTPSEYDANVRNILAGNHSSFQELVYKNGITTIKTR